MNALAPIIINAAIALGEVILKQESGFISDEIGGLIGEAQVSLRALLDASIPVAQKELIWRRAQAALKAAAQKCEDEVASEPSNILSQLFSVVSTLLSVGFNQLI